MPLTCTLVIQDLSTARVVMRVEGEEALHELFHYEVEAAIVSPPEGAALLGRKALLQITCGPDGSTLDRFVSGVITAKRDLGAITIGTTAYRLLGLRIEPALAAWDLDEDGEVYTQVCMRDLAVALLEGRPAPGKDPIPELKVDFSTASLQHNLPFPVRHQVFRYRESRLAFLRRILAEDGLSLRFAHVPPGYTFGTQTADATLGAHVAVVGDGSGYILAKAPGASDATMLPWNSLELGVGESQPAYRGLRQWREEYADVPWRVEVADSDYRAWPTGSKVPGPGQCDLAVAGTNLRPTGADSALRRIRDGRDLSGDVDGASSWAPPSDLAGANAWLAKRRGDSLCARRRRVIASGDHLLLAPGCSFTRAGASEHWQVVRSRLRLITTPSVTLGQELNGKDQSIRETLLALGQSMAEGWAATGGSAARPTALGGLSLAWNSGTLTGSIEIEAVPDVLAWRPPRPEPPRLAGLHIATVSGAPTGSKLAVNSDSLGRVKVRFPWATADSGFLRVAMPLAGKGYGFDAVPRLGDAVAVVFPPDCPDRPVVVGCLHTAVNPPAFAATTDRGRIALRSRMLDSGDVMPSAAAAAGRVGDMAVGDDGLSTNGANADSYHFSELALVDGDNAADRGIDLFTSGRMREQVGGERIIRVGKKLTIEAGELIELKVGDTILRMTPSSTVLGFRNPTFPAFGSLLTINPVMIKAVGPVIELKGWMRAKMSSAASSFSAQGAFAKSKGFACDMSSDAIQALGDMVGSMITVFGSAAQDKDSRDRALRDSNYLVPMIKEYLLASIDLAKFLGVLAVKTRKSPADLFGEATVEAQGGLASLKAKPPNATTFGKIRSAVRIIQAATHAGQGNLTYVNNDASEGAGTGIGIGDGAMTATLGVMDLYDAISASYCTNVLTLAPVSGFEIKGTWWDKIVAKANDTHLQASEKAVKDDKLALKDDKTTGSDSTKALLDDNQKVVKQDGAGAEAEQRGADNEAQLATANAELVKGNSAIAQAAAGAINKEGAIINAVTPG